MEKTRQNYSRLKIFLGLTFIITWISWWILAYLIQTEKLFFEEPLAQLILIIGGSTPTWVAYIAVTRTKEHANIAEFNQRAFKIKLDFKF